MENAQTVGITGWSDAPQLIFLDNIQLLIILFLSIACGTVMLVPGVGPVLSAAF
jgi:hypothetical protein